MENSDFPKIKTVRFWLRQIVPEDLEKIFAGLSDPRVTQYYGVSYSTLEDTKNQLEWFRNLEQMETGIWWAICSHDNATFLGAAGFNNTIKEHKKTEIGYWLLPEFWRQGVIQEVLPPLLDYAFNTLNLIRVEAQVESENLSSIKSLTQLGFQHEGTLKNYEIKNEKPIDLSIFAIFKNEES